MKKIKVLIIAGSMDVGGIENQLMHLLRNSDKEQFEIGFTSTMPNAFYREEIEQLGGKFHIIPQMNWKNPMPYCKALYDIMKNEKYDVVHSHELFHTGIVLKVANFANIPVKIAHAHSISDSYGNNSKRSWLRTVYNKVMQMWILRYSTVQIACASTAGEFLFGKKITKKDSFHLAYNSIDTKKYIEKYDQIENGEFTDDSWINILHVGRVYPVKRQLFDVEIAEVFQKQGKKIRILCAGNAFDEIYMKQIETQIQERNLQNHMIMLGSRNDIDVLFRKSAVAILPSVYEGMPLVMLEAQSAGLPCVVSDTFSHEVDFELGNVQWLSNSASAQEWAEAIEKEIDKPRTDKEQIIKVINEKNFDSRKFAEKLCNIYKDALWRNEK